jgi:hypothetical protein
MAKAATKGGIVAALVAAVSGTFEDMVFFTEMMVEPVTFERERECP